MEPHVCMYYKHLTLLLNVFEGLRHIVSLGDFVTTQYVCSYRG